MPRCSWADGGGVLNLEEKLFLSQNMYSDPAQSKENAVAEATALLSQALVRMSSR
jgi:hypothetical protein